jgi:hypothetical protein
MPHKAAFALFFPIIAFYNISMKRLFTPNKFFIAIIFFCLGFWTNHLLVKNRGLSLSTVSQVAHRDQERFPIDPADFDQQNMMNTIKRMREEGELGASGMGEVAQHEDEKNVYYDIPLKSENGSNHKLNVEIKNGMIKISEDVKAEGDAMVQTSSERMFSIDPGLDGDKAEVINEKEKVTIKIPKKNN